MGFRVGFRGKGVLAVGHILADCIGSETAELADRLGGMASPVHVDSIFMGELCDFLASSVRNLSWTAGGGATNMAKAARGLGMDAEVWACAGRDERGDFLAAELAKAGISAHLTESDKPTGVFCSFAAQDGGRRIIVSQGAARDIRGVEIPDVAFRRGWVLYIDGLLIDSLPWLKALAGKAKAKGMLVAMDLSTPGNAASQAGKLAEFSASFCDIVFANEKEFAALRNSLPRGSLPGEPQWVLKKGRRGAALLSGGRMTEAPAVAIEAVDDTGAGDAFAAGYLGARMEGFSDMRCLQCGNAVASAAIMGRGSGFDAGRILKAYEVAFSNSI